MPQVQINMTDTLRQVDAVLTAALAIDVEALELLVQQAHECDIHQTEAPPEPFDVPRQALRMVWRFRRNLEATEIKPDLE